MSLMNGSYFKCAGVGIFVDCQDSCYLLSIHLISIFVLFLSVCKMMNRMFIETYGLTIKSWLNFFSPSWLFMVNELNQPCFKFLFSLYTVNYYFVYYD